MNPALIILGVVVIIIIYMYFFYSTGVTVLSNKLDLSTQQTAIPVASIADPGASRYAYECWVYMNQYDGGKKTLFYRDSDKQLKQSSISGNSCAESNSGTTLFKNISLYVEGSSPTLKVDYVKNNDTVAGSVPTSSGVASCTGFIQSFQKGTLVITDNFPIQTWVHIIVSVDNNYIDTYINGKLTKSIKEKDGIYAPLKTSPLTFGVSAGTSLAKLTRYNTPIDPQTAWDKYSVGNGANQFSKYLGTLGLDVSLKKDNMEYSKLNIF